MTPGDPYEEFVERYFEDGATEVPADWPPELRARCLFFLRLAGDGPLNGSTASLRCEGTVILGRSDARGPAEAVSFGTRYVIEGELARGGMGRILLAFDQDLRRRIAVKVLLSSQDDGGRTSRFLEEAQATAQLEHPNIAPLYDAGRDPSGAPFFTMKWIRGRNLKEVLSTPGREASLIRLLQIVQQAAMGVHFANSRGVIHRDLKPENVMVGDYGEVLVVDWGLAKFLGRPGTGVGEGSPVSTERREEGQGTIEGTVQGSPAYMAPEQARGGGREIDARTDVFGLGAILYEVLTGVPPYPHAPFQVMLARARSGQIVPARERAPDRLIPPALDAACRKALSARKDDRFQDAGELHAALQDYMEGIHDAERRAAEAARLRGEADALRTELGRAEEKAAALRAEEHALRASLEGHDAEEKKRPLWDLSARAQVARKEAAAAFGAATAAYRAVLGIHPADRAARESLAEIFHGRLLEAEARGDREAAALYEGLVAQHDDGRYRLELEGAGRLRLQSDPPGAEVLLARFEERGPLLEESALEHAGKTPLDIALPRGSYVAVLGGPGSAEVRYPFVIERSSLHDGRVRLPADGSIAEGFIFIPGGPTITGGDTELFPTLPRATVVVGDFFLARFPVTFEEYCLFLDEECRDDPSRREHVPTFGKEVFYAVQGADGRFGPIARFDPRMPVIAITTAAAGSYCEWLSARIGRKARLPTELEWERAARGADGRLFPWGNGFDWALAKGRLSRPGDPFLEPVGAFPRSVSPFGVRDLAGGVNEMCEGSYGQGHRPTRGGSWFNAAPYVFRADWRLSFDERGRATDIGFRVCYSSGG
jgi:serine/threonine-protein kinase